MTEKTAKKRIWELDFVRGILILIMFFDHLTFDFYLVMPTVWGDIATPFIEKCFDFGASWWRGSVRPYVFSIDMCLYMFLAGITSAFSRSKVRNTVKLGVIAVVITSLTALLDVIMYGGNSNLIIVNGVIHAYAFFGLVQLLVDKLDSVVLIRGKKHSFNLSQIVCILIVILGATSYFVWYDPFTTKGNFITFVLGLTPGAGYSADYVAVLPWISPYFLGVLIRPFIYPDKKSLLPSLDGKWNKPLCTVGRYSLYLYVSHQVIIYALITVVFSALTGQFRVF